MRYFIIVGVVLASGLMAQSAKTASFEILQSGFEKLGAASEIRNTKPLKSKQLRDEAIKILKDELKPGTIIRGTSECPFRRTGNNFLFQLSCVRHDHNEFVPLFMEVKINYEGLTDGRSAAEHPFTPRTVAEQFEEIQPKDIFQGEVEIVEQQTGTLRPSPVSQFFPTFTEYSTDGTLWIIGRLKSIDKTP